MTRKRLSSKIKFHVIYQDDTLFGSAITNQCDVTVRKLCTSIVNHRKAHGLQNVVTRSRQLISDTMAPGGLADLYIKPNVLREGWLYPVREQVVPVAIDIERGVGDIIARIELPSELFADLAAYLGAWERGATPPTNAIARQLWDAFEQLCIFEEDKSIDLQSPIEQPTGQATFIGHSTVKISDRTSSLLIDPFLLPQADAYPAAYQPLSLREIGTIDAVFITHAHPDHFDLGTLLRLGADTPIFVPQVERESVLSIEMAFRLRQLGFRQVHVIDWYGETQVGAIRIVALPFYGEQPTVSEVLHPEVRNQGNTYLVEVGDRRFVLTADSGTDHKGNAKQLAAQTFAAYGSINALFGGYRNFGLYPIQYLFSSVSRYLPFVPQSSWHVRQQLMCNADELMDLAERWDAECVVPYADGGAPWYWMRGLGPCLDGSETHLMAIDPTPEFVCEVAGCRSGTRRDGLIASPVPVCLLRPGDALAWEGAHTQVQPHPGWIYGNPQAGDLIPA